MEIWIRSQDREHLEKVDTIELYECSPNDWVLQNACRILGRYKTYDRAIEVLDDIQSKMKNKYLAKANAFVKNSDFIKAAKELESINDIDLIASNGLVDIMPINQEVLVYQMPNE